ncbi:cysteine-rich CWC family protein [Vaginella massiliensis]|uniref:cysteine-rich CWC family protein n=1 Tax=Vaginella massiliensis TaxID=1816680 RepID=UPI000838F14B|nr:cysteine-rich CWC family protein [Vaginella massiliensis]
MSIKNCQRCHQDFECLADDIQKCNCNSLELKPETQAFLGKTYYDCLCEKCLKTLDGYADLAKQYPFPQDRSMYIPEVHYYIENQYWVFTEFFHYQKGRCCGNNCRHCAYGFKQKIKKGGFY